MTANAEARLAEACDNVWLGDVAALEESLTHLRRRRVAGCELIISLLLDEGERLVEPHRLTASQLGGVGRGRDGDAHVPP